MKNKTMLFVMFLVVILNIFSVVSAEGKGYYFSFSRGKFSDNASQQQLGKSMIEMVGNAARALNTLTMKELFDIPPADVPVVSPQIIKSELAGYSGMLAGSDTMIIYSHSHGVLKGLLLYPDVYTWEDFASDILNLPAKNVIVLPMSCHSGALVNLLKTDPYNSRWKNRKSQGRNFLVVTPVSADQISGPALIDGKKQNSFSYAVTKALSGEADTSADGKTTFKEFAEYIIAVSREKSQTPKFEPQIAGSYDDNQILLPLNSAAQTDVSSSDNTVVQATDTGTISDAADKYLRPLVDQTGKNGTPALVCGIVTGKGNKVFSYGTTTIGSSIKPGENTFFNIGSVTKLFAGIILANAVVNGKMPLDAFASKFMPSAMKISPRVTLKHLVTHYSGYPSYPKNMKAFRDFDNDGKNDSDSFYPAKNYSPDLLSSYLKNAQPESIPGEKYEYSNLGIGLLSIALKNCLNYSDFDEMLEKELTEKLKMNDTGFNSPSFVKKTTNRRAIGYAFRNNEVVALPLADMGVLAFGGEGISTVSDMMTLLKVMCGIQQNELSKAAKEVEKPLAEENSERMIGYTVDIRESAFGGKIYSKSGATAGTASLVMWRHNPEVGLVIFTNRGSFQTIATASLDLFEKTTEILLADNQATGTNIVSPESVARKLFQEYLGRNPIQGEINAIIIKAGHSTDSEVYLNLIRQMPEYLIRKKILSIFRNISPDGKAPLILKIQNAAMKVNPPLSPLLIDFATRFKEVAISVLQNEEYYRPQYHQIVKRWFLSSSSGEMNIALLSYWIREIYEAEQKGIPLANVRQRFMREHSSAVRLPASAGGGM
ncbi:MAG: beta-lactamase family protein [Candidatus Riflebacteria bacterium]|nr:beta-lactamase family protein [Candidatus Riflebacteria bacterium]